mgnify:CR=1 FL=1
MAKEEIIQKVKETMEAPSCFAGLKAVCQECVQSIDSIIPFFKSEAGVKYFGKETAAALAKAADEAKEKGSKYCICPACTAGGYLLDHIHEL